MLSVAAALALALALLAAAAPCAAIQAPNTSLATVPCAYFGGNSATRDEANIQMLSRMRIVMLEKWEGPCWADCLANQSSPSCQASCNVENDILDTHRRVKQLNPNVSSVLYLNTLLDFPFYTLHGRYEAAHAETVDNITKVPIKIRNDNGMEGIYVFGFDDEAGVQLYIDAVTNLTATGLVDGFFGDKWDKGAVLDANTGQWQICNHECGNVSAQQAVAWNAGKTKVLQAVTKHVGAGPYFANGGDFNGVGSNLHGSWNNDHFLDGGDPRDGIANIKQLMINHTYVYASSTGDQHWTTDPNDPANLVTKCSAGCLARFLLMVEEGVFLGTNGWDEAYWYPLGDPLGPALYHEKTASAPALLTRNFTSGTYVVFTYHGDGKDGDGVIYWEGKPPPPPTPPPPPPTPAPPPPPGPPIKCGGALAVTSSVLNGTTYAYGDVTASTTLGSYSACCNACAEDTKCAIWAWHSDGNACHLHSRQATRKAKLGCVSGVLTRD